MTTRECGIYLSKANWSRDMVQVKQVVENFGASLFGLYFQGLSEDVLNLQKIIFNFL